MSDQTSGNLLLDSLSPDALRALQPHTETHDIGKVLITAEETPAFVFFPHRHAVVSMVRTTEQGAMVEAGVVGDEGLLNVQTAITAPAPTGTEAIVQNEGRLSRVEVRRMQALFRDDVTFRDHVLAFTSLYLEQLTQNLLCNRLHSIEQRLSKWLLIVRDRTGTEELHLTHEFLAHMLGIHRPGVSIAISALEVDALIQHGRNLILIRDGEGLVRRSCECYGVLHEKLLTFRSARTLSVR
jgi:hypothetical protein